MKNHFQKINLNPDQERTIESINNFLSNDSQIFILQGYAGTGKTTLIQGLVDFCMAENMNFDIMAPTGKAAKILRDKTGYGKTIHSSIYKLQQLISINKEADELADHSLSYYFPIDIDSLSKRIVIVDEASMVSSKEEKNELFNFGTDVLLDDLLTYVFQSNKDSKIIFVGDPAQLPPVGGNQSNALFPEFFIQKGFSCQFEELTQIMRQDNNLILKNARTIRRVLNETHKNELQFDYDEESFIKLESKDLVEVYLNKYPKPNIGNGVIIAFSNAQCYQYNYAIRKVLFPDKKTVFKEDLLIINSNHYNYEIPLFNGDLVQVKEVSDTVQKLSAPIWKEENNKKIRKIVTVEFRKITFEKGTNKETLSCFIAESLLNSMDNFLPMDMKKVLYINFVMRFKEEQKRRFQNGQIEHKVGSLEFKEQLKQDPYYNVVLVKYAYAITCHKAQGGEWDQVWVDYTGRVGLFKDALKWSYTATTRAINKLYAINPPCFTSFSKLKFSTIIKTTNIPKNALFLEKVNTSPFHQADHHKGKSFKFWELKDKLEKIDYKIVDIFSRDYLERYTIQNNENEKIILEANHKASGHFIDVFKIQNENAKGTIEEEVLLELFNKNEWPTIELGYTPSQEYLETLFSVIRQLCSELEIIITNIDEQVSKYYVTYHLKATSIAASIKFCFKKNGSFTTAIPSVFSIEKDDKLELLIEKLSEYAL